MANLQSEDIHQLVADPPQSDSDAASDDLILSVPSPLKLLSAPFSKPPHERIRDALVERLKEDKEKLLQEIEALKREKEIAIEQKNQAKEELLSSWAEMEEAWEYKEEEVNHVMKVMEKMEQRNKEVELRDRELKNDLKRFKEIEEELKDKNLVEKLVYNAISKGFLNDEDDEDDEKDAKNKEKENQQNTPQSVNEQLEKRQNDISEIERWVQSRKEQKEKESGKREGEVDSKKEKEKATETKPEKGNIPKVEKIEEERRQNENIQSQEKPNQRSRSNVVSETLTKQPPTSLDDLAILTKPKEQEIEKDRSREQKVTFTKDSEKEPRDKQKLGSAKNKTSPTLQDLFIAGDAKEGAAATDGERERNRKSGQWGNISQQMPSLATQQSPTRPARPGHRRSPSYSPSSSGHSPSFSRTSGPPNPPPPPPSHFQKPADRPRPIPPLSLNSNHTFRTPGSASSSHNVPTLSLSSLPSNLPPPQPAFEPDNVKEPKKDKVAQMIDEYCGNGLNENEDETNKVPVACDELAKTLIERRVYIQTTDREQVKACNRFFVYALRAINTCVKSCERDSKSQCFWLSYTTSLIHRIKRETKGKIPGMKEIKDPRKHGIQLISANKLLKKITTLPSNATSTILMSRKIELCGFACKLLQIVQRIYSNLLKIARKQLEPFLIPVIFYHDKVKQESPFSSMQSFGGNSGGSGSSYSARDSQHSALVSPRGPLSGSGSHSHSSSNAPYQKGSIPAQNSAEHAPSSGRSGGGLTRSMSSNVLSSLLGTTTTSSEKTCKKTTQDIILILSRKFYAFQENNVYCCIIQQYFMQVYFGMDAVLFNYLIENARKLATVSNALSIKSILPELLSWRTRNNLSYRKSKSFSHLKDAVNVLSITKNIFLELDVHQAFTGLNDLQILHLLVHFQPDELAPESVPARVMKKLQERSQQAKNNPLKLDPTLMFPYKRKQSLNNTNTIGTSSSGSGIIITATATASSNATGAPL